MYKYIPWMCLLSKDKKSLNLEFEHILKEISYRGTFTLNLNCVTLGLNPVKTERNIVEVETKDFSKKTKKWTILNLHFGINTMTMLDINFYYDTKFKLISGSGPVHITGIFILRNLSLPMYIDVGPKHKKLFEIPTENEPSDEKNEEEDSQEKEEDSEYEAEEEEEENEEKNAESEEEDNQNEEEVDDDEEDEEEKSSEEETKKKPTKRKVKVTPKENKKRKLAKGKADDSLDKDETYKRSNSKKKKSK